MGGTSDTVKRGAELERVGQVPGVVTRGTDPERIRHLLELQRLIIQNMRTALLRISEGKHFVGCKEKDQAVCKCYEGYANLALHQHFEGWDVTGETGELVKHTPISKGDAHEGQDPV